MQHPKPQADCLKESGRIPKGMSLQKAEDGLQLRVGINLRQAKNTEGKFYH